MKKRFICLIILLIFIISIFNNTTYAGFHYTPYVGSRQPISRISQNVGKAAGQYYTTNIRAFLNYTEIESYNIGGKTLICVEDFTEHGFTVYWEPLSGIIEARPTKPYPADDGNKNFGKPTKKLEMGKPIGNHYITEVLVFVDNQQIESYNIGGRTLICIEDLSYCGFNVYWDPENRTIAANIQAPPAENRDFDQAQKYEYYQDEDHVVRTTTDIVGIGYPELTWRGYDPTEANASYKGLVWMSLCFDEEVSEKTVMSVLNKRYFPVLNENGEDISDNFNYMFIHIDPDIPEYSSYQLPEGKQLWDLVIALSSEFLYKNGYDSPENIFRTDGRDAYFPYFLYTTGCTTPESCYYETVKIYIPENITDGMSPIFHCYYECPFVVARIPTLYCAYGIYEEFFDSATFIGIQ